MLYKNIKIKIYRTMILTVVVYGCESCSLTLREKRRLRVSENRALRIIFGPKKNGGRLEWRRLNNEELNNLYLLTPWSRVLLEKLTSKLCS